MDYITILLIAIGAGDYNTYKEGGNFVLQLIIMPAYTWFVQFVLPFLY